ncbi:hypothetical protein JGS39_00590 [Streptomyces sp. P01-B04]|uniref:hypothetical protein n=1 Tax=Streptomyces poriferorum TaxID=2798799 RepID=UPI001C5FCF4A|nr:hypothetical protein [Streptomyces poriferorum]MBW5247536.1 hypothetical protein [Streptomyces poriferorum]MBW5255424.1 hypothetical protein [Streptomyces poriferorum]
MATKPAPGRTLHTGIDTTGTFPVEYRFAHARNGNQHLVVVFANFSVPNDYGWSNGVFDTLRSNVLWIRDRFHGKNSYYLCKDMDFGLERSVATLISNVLNSLGLTPDQCTMWGGSKGGSAALYFGLKYGFRNIVSMVPQFRIGTYVSQYPSIAQHMMGEATEQNIQIIDDAIPSLVRAGANRTANIYLLSSPQDEQFETQVEPFLPLFVGYENLNFIFSDSPHIVNHAHVTGRNLPMLMGLVNFLIDGMAPRIGFVRSGGELPDADRSAIDAYLKATSEVQEDFAAPVIHAPAAGETVSGQTVRFTGSAPGAARLSIWEHGKFLGAPEVAADGSWTWELGRSWSVGKHAVRVLGVDAAGFQSQRSEAVFTVAAAAETAADQPAGPVPSWAAQPAPEARTAPPSQPATPTAPYPPVVSAPAQGQQIQGPSVGIMGYAQGAARVEFVEDGMRLGMAQVAPDSSWSWESGWSWTEGPHTVECHAVDMNGQGSPRTTVTFQVAYAQAPTSPEQHSAAPRY